MEKNSAISGFFALIADEITDERRRIYLRQSPWAAQLGSFSKFRKQHRRGPVSDYQRKIATQATEVWN